MNDLTRSTIRNLVLATRNAHKAQELQQLVGGRFRVLTLAEFPEAPEVIEDGMTFDANAQKKALSLADWLQRSGKMQQLQAAGELLVLADDSGLEVDALHGAPGVHSARFAALDTGAAGNSPDAANNARLLRLLDPVPDGKRTARFRCVLALVATSDNPGSAARVELFDGVCEGRITRQPSGAGGFGYDPLFIPEGSDRSFAELGAEVKNRISHRARAFQKLAAYLAH